MDILRSKKRVQLGVMETKERLMIRKKSLIINMTQNNREQEEWIKEREAEVVHHIRGSPGEEELQGSGMLNPTTEEPSSAFSAFPHSNFFICNNSLCQV